MTLSIIVAASANNVIGAGGQLPWRLPEDLRHFRRTTMGKPMIMGRLTYESIGKALPGRHSIVVTRRPDYAAEGCDIVASPEAALELAADADEVMIIGGGNIYAQMLPMTDRIYLTRVHAEFDGDTFLPGFGTDDWKIVSCESLPASDARPFAISFEVLERRLLVPVVTL